MKYYKPSITNSLVNVSCSILKCFNTPYTHKTIKELDDYIKGKQKVVLMLFDGMGKSIVDKHLDEKSFLRQHILKKIDSTFPPTTVAATDALLSAKFPIENGWLGWTSYSKEKDKFIETFTGYDHYTGEYIDANFIYKVAPYKSILDQINDSNKEVICDSYWPGFSNHNACINLNDFFNKIDKGLKENDKNIFLYCYWDDPDHTIHNEGTSSLLVKKIVNDINVKLEELVQNNKDTTFIVLADHSLTDVKYLFLDDYEDFKDTLLRNISIDSRACNFYVKEDKKDLFEKLFNKYFGEYFELFNKEEVLNNHIFGDGTPHPFSLETLGDYLAISISEYCFANNDKAEIMVANHAGGLKEESEIYLCGFNGNE